MIKLADLKVGMLINHPLDSFCTNQRVLEIGEDSVRFMFFPFKTTDWVAVDPNTEFILVQK